MIQQLLSRKTARRGRIVPTKTLHSSKRLTNFAQRSNRLERAHAASQERNSWRPALIDPVGGGWGWDVLGIKAPHLIAGALGGFVRVLSRPEEGMTRKIFTTMVGAIVAGYATSPVTGIALNYLSAYRLDEASIAGSVGFVLGLCGLSICEGIIRIAQRWRDKGEI